MTAHRPSVRRRIIARAAIAALPVGLVVSVVTPRLAPAQVLAVPTAFGPFLVDTSDFFDNGGSFFDGSDRGFFDNGSDNSGDDISFDAPINITQGGIGSTGTTSSISDF
jgi:hypothetical protein